ncbi:MAG: hypothetical protein ABFR97_10350 [Thermodesulfobacteriota bacterium]
MKQTYLTFIGLTLLLAGCSSEPPPFTARYLSPNLVEVDYQGTKYNLDRSAPQEAETPFSYSFEEDGDLDIVINGKSYEVDSPYDIDRPKRKTTRKSSRKTSTRKSKKK